MKQKWFPLLGGSALLFGLMLATLFLQPAGIAIVIDGEAYTVQASSRVVLDVLLENQIPLLPQDSILPELNDRVGRDETITIERARWVQFWQANELVAEILSPNRVPQELAAEAGLTLPENSQLRLNGEFVDIGQELARTSQLVFEIIPSIQFEVLIGDESTSIETTAATLGEALLEAGIILNAVDLVSMPLAEPPQNNSIVTIERAIPITVTVGDQVVQGYSAAKTVGAALADIGLSAQGLDYTIPALDQPVPNDATFELIRVHEEVYLEKSTTPYSSRFEPDPDLALDGRSLMQAGLPGIDVTRTRARFENGSEVSRTTEESWTASEPQDEILGYGQLVTTNSLSTEYGNLQYYRAVEMYATSYHPCAFSDGCHYTTRGGCTLEKGVVAVAADWYPSMVGQEVYIPGYGKGVVCDSGGGIADRYWIDLGFSDEDYVGWYHWVTVYFLTPVPETILWVLP